MNESGRVSNRGWKLCGSLLAVAAAAVGAAVAAMLWWRGRPSACPYGLRIWIQVPHPFITRERLRKALGLQPGERVLEIGPGTGYYSLPVAKWLGAEGRLDVFDLQRKMLNHTMRRAGESGISNIVPAQGDATRLPYEDDTFDSAFLVTVLGEIPDRAAALRELRRVLRPGGLLVVGEIWGADPHWIGPKALRASAASTGFEFERIDEYLLGHYAVLRRPYVTTAESNDMAGTNQ